MTGRWRDEQAQTGGGKQTARDELAERVQVDRWRRVHVDAKREAYRGVLAWMESQAADLDEDSIANEIRRRLENLGR